MFVSAPDGSPSNVKTVYRDGTSIKLTWSRPKDSFTDFDYPFNYSLCIGQQGTNNTCDVVTDNSFHYTFKGLQPLTEYFITIRAQSANMSGEAFNLTASTIEEGKISKTHYYTTPPPQRTAIAQGPVLFKANSLHSVECYGHCS